METEKIRRDDLIGATSTIDEALESTHDDGPHDPTGLVSGGSTVPDRAEPPGGLRSTIDTWPEVPGETLDSPGLAHDDLGWTLYRDPDETRSDFRRPGHGALESAASLKGREIVPGFEVLSVLGRGGMGVVYKARQLRLNRLVALKMIRSDRHADPENHARFEIEAEAVARLRHPNILQIYQIGRSGGVPFEALELLDGGTLSKKLAGTPQPFRESASLLAIVARAIHAAHLAGIVHRDLKPSNILFDLEGIPKIADFGLAKRLEVDDGETFIGQVIGTPSYMAPEQARGWSPEIGAAADVYSLGAILYEMLTGHPPLKGMTSAETLALVLTEEPVAPSRLRPKIPFDLETICLKTIAREPRKRYADALALAEDLDRYLAGQPIKARRTPLWEKAFKLVRRRPTTSMLVVAGILAIAGAAGAVRHNQMLAREQSRQEDLRIEGLREFGEKALFEAQSALAEKHWDDGRVTLSKLVSRIDREPRLVELHAKANGLLETARHGLAGRRSGEEARARLRRFLDARDEALFLDTRFVGVDAEHPLEATCKAARAGLGLFAREESPDRWALASLPSSLSGEERGDVAAGQYELLLILADAVSQSPGEEPERRAEQALRIIDQAANARSPATRAFHLRKSAYFEMKGDADAAAKERAEADRLPAADAFDLFLSGRELFRRSDWAGAVPYFGAALQKQPDHFWSQCLLAICHLQTAQPSKAQIGFNACLLRKPKFAWLYLLRGIANANAGELARETARRYPDQAATLGKVAAGQADAAEADYLEALGLLGEDGRGENAELRYVLRVNRGLIRLERNDLEAAATDLREAIRLNGRRFDAYSALGQVYQRQGRIEDSLGQFTKAIELRPRWAPLHRARAEVLIGLKTLTPAQRQAALRDLDDAVRFEAPGKLDVANDQAKRAALLHRDGRDEDALAACDAAIATSPRLPAAHRLRIQILLELKRYHDLMTSCDAAIASGDRSALVHELRGMAREEMEDYYGATDDYTSSLNLDAKNPRVLRRRGWSYLSRDSYKDAEHDFDEAIRLDETDADAYMGRGFARVRLGQLPDAVRDAERALRHGEPESWRVSYNAARIYARASEAAKAGPLAIHRVVAYQDRAVALIREALRRAPADRRPALLRETFLDDPALQPVQRRLRALDGLKLGAESAR